MKPVECSDVLVQFQ